MNKFEIRGNDLRKQTKELILDFMNSSEVYGPNGEGIRQAQIFKTCGLDWGDYPKAKSTTQQYWVVAVLRELEAEGHLVRISESGPWRLTH